MGKSTKIASGVRVIASTDDGNGTSNFGFTLNHDDRGSSSAEAYLACKQRHADLVTFVRGGNPVPGHGRTAR